MESIEEENSDKEEPHQLQSRKPQLIAKRGLRQLRSLEPLVVNTYPSNPKPSALGRRNFKKVIDNFGHEKRSNLSKKAFEIFKRKSFSNEENRIKPGIEELLNSSFISKSSSSSVSDLELKVKELQQLKE